MSGSTIMMSPIAAEVSAPGKLGPGAVPTCCLRWRLSQSAAYTTPDGRMAVCDTQYILEQKWVAVDFDNIAAGNTEAWIPVTMYIGK